MHKRFSKSLVFMLFLIFFMEYSVQAFEIKDTQIKSLAYTQEGKISSGNVEYKLSVENRASQEYEVVKSKPGITYTFSDMSKLLVSNKAKGWKVSTIQYDYKNEGTLIEPKEYPLESLTVPLELSGYFKVYVGYASGTRGFKIKKNTDSDYIQVYSDIDSSSSEDYSKQYLYEKLALIDNFNNANLVLKELGNTRIAYIRLVGLTEDEIKLIETPDESENGKRVMYDNDGYSDFFDGIYSDPEDLKTKFVYPLAKKNVGTINWCLGTTGLLNYNSKYAGPAFADFDKYRSQLRQGDIRAKEQVLNILKTGKSPLEIVAEAAKEKNMKVNASLRMDTFYPADKFGFLNGKIYDSYKDVKQTGEYGLSYFYPKTRAYITNVLKEAVSFKNVDGITLDYCRYPVVMNKEATQKQKVAIMTEFMRNLRKQIPKDKTITARIPYDNSLTYGFDVKTWIKEGLIDVLIPSNITVDDFFNVKPYVDMVKGSNVKLYIGICANVSGGDLTKEEEKYIQAGYEVPKKTFLALNQYLLRAREVYKAGAEGVFLFNTSSAVLIDTNSPEISKFLNDKVALEKWYNFYYNQPMKRESINIIEKKL
jgi:hypothetical protein